MRLVLAGLLVACGSKHEGDVPLRIANPPVCPGPPAKTAVIRLEHGSDYMQEPLAGARLTLSSSWRGRTATVKVGFCVERDKVTTDCSHPAWIRGLQTTIGGDDHELVVEVPKFELPCADGSIAKN